MKAQNRYQTKSFLKGTLSACVHLFCWNSLVGNLTVTFAQHKHQWSNAKNKLWLTLHPAKIPFLHEPSRKNISSVWKSSTNNLPWSSQLFHSEGAGKRRGCPQQRKDSHTSNYVVCMHLVMCSTQTTLAWAQMSLIRPTGARMGGP